MSTRRPMNSKDYIGLFRRRWLLILVPAILGPAIAFGITLLLHSRYTSESLMIIEQQQVPESYVKPVITSDLNSRIAAIQGQVLSRTRLQPIIERLSLFKEEAPHQTMEELMLRLRNAITLTPIKPIVSARDQTLPGFYIDVTLDDARKAQQVCAEIASMFVEENIRQREGSAQGTSNFLQGQLEAAKQKLDEQDARLAAFKRQRMGMLPDETQTNLNLLGTLNTQLEAVTQSLNRAQQDKVYAQSVLEQQLKTWEISNNIGADTDPMQKRLADLQNQLVNLQSRYKPEHPDVLALQGEIDKLKKKMQQAGSALTDDKEISKKSEASKLPEPPQIQQLRAQLHGYEGAVKAGTREQGRLRQQIREYQSRLQMSPVVEQEYKEITRDHQTALEFYNDLLSKRDQSAMATNMERQEGGERLRVLDPANLPDKPSFPDRAKFAVTGAAIGLALGLALAFVIDRNGGCLRTQQDVEFYLGQAALAAIPIIKDSTKRVSQNRGARA